ncbi:MAG TPA: hypothetical protein VEX68_26525 [Bryobacteraceae bacterium]|nr:hypothetical protein [Bryobacteraceae bacterium]
MTLGANRAHPVRATLEAIAYQTKELTDAMQTDSGAGVPCAPCYRHLENTSEVEQFWRAENVFEPQMEGARREELFAGWKRAVARA